MKIKPFLFLAFLTVTSLLQAQQIVSMNDLVQTDHLIYYEGELFTGDAYGYADNVPDPIKLHYVDGVANGVLTGYYDEERIHVKWLVPVINGKQHGQYVHYYEDGTICFTAYKRLGKIHGKRYCFSEDGTLWHVHHYHKGKEHGPSLVYYQSDGTIMAERNFRKDQLHGTYIGYTRYGDVERTGRYRNGKNRVFGPLMPPMEKQ